MVFDTKQEQDYFLRLHLLWDQHMFIANSCFLGIAYKNVMLISSFHTHVVSRQYNNQTFISIPVSLQRWRTLTTIYFSLFLSAQNNMYTFSFHKLHKHKVWYGLKTDKAVFRLLAETCRLVFSQNFQNVFGAHPTRLQGPPCLLFNR